MPKNIKSSVGFGGTNDPSSVMTVQYLLNCVPAAHGGASPELVVDGIIGPKTIGAIRGFQNTWFGHADGRVDPGGKTLHTLQPHDPLPNHAVTPTDVVKVPAPPAPFTTSASYRAAYKTPGGGAPGKHSPTTGWGPMQGGAGGGGASGKVGI
jgi:peptidoglycan hydrolase-like protein with peptidoglycan-binding domain